MPEALRSITCGRPVAAIEAAAFQVTDVHYAPGDSYASHAHDRAYVVLVWNGGFRETTAEGEVELSSGGVIVMPAAHPHDDTIAARGARGLLVTLEPSFSLLPRRWHAAHGGAVSRAMIALALAYRDGGAAEMLAVEEQLVDAIARASNDHRQPRDARAVRIARELLEAHAEQPVRFSRVAREAGVAPAYLSRAFRRHTGVTMGEHLRGLRAKRAASRLASSRDPLAEIAIACGFADQSHLSRVFRSQYGITPRRYRELARSNSFKT